LRHRAALGLSEKSSDSTAIVVSEETGHIAVAKEGKIRNVTRDELIQILSSAMALKSK